MQLDVFLTKMADGFKHCLDLAKERSDYAKKENAFENLMAAERLDIGTTEEGMLREVIKKLIRTKNSLRKEPRPIKSINNDVDDMINYLMFLRIYVQWKDDMSFDDKVPLPGRNDV